MNNLKTVLEASSNKVPSEIIALIVGVVVIVLIPIITLIIKRVSLGKQKIDQPSEMESFLSKHEELDVNKALDKKCNFKGVYVIFNDTKQAFYISSSDNVSEDLNKQFNGIGNNAIYNDFKYGDKFKIKIINFKDSKYADINKLEKDIKEVYSSFAENYKSKKRK